MSHPSISSHTGHPENDGHNSGSHRAVSYTHLIPKLSHIQIDHTAVTLSLIHISNYKLLDEMYQDNYYPTFLVDKVKDELQKVIALLESGETDTEVVQETLDEAVCGINDLQEEFDENDSEIETVARECIAAVSYTHLQKAFKFLRLKQTYMM